MIKLIKNGKIIKDTNSLLVSKFVMDKELLNLKEDIQKEVLYISIGNVDIIIPKELYEEFDEHKTCTLEIFSKYGLVKRGEYIYLTKKPTKNVFIIVYNDRITLFSNNIENSKVSDVFYIKNDKRINANFITRRTYYNDDKKKCVKSVLIFKNPSDLHLYNIVGDNNFYIRYLRKDKELFTRKLNKSNKNILKKYI